MSRLEQLLEAARENVEQRRSRISEQDLRERLGSRSGSRPFKEALVRPGLSLIAEFKRGSPSAGEIDSTATVERLVCSYEDGGAAAISVLTEERYFGGSLEDLQAAVSASNLPILRKDFIVDPYQVVESAVAGADAVLLIVAGLADEDLKLLFEEAASLDLDCVVEVHDEQDLERALLLDPEVIGINNRDLHDFGVDLEVTRELITDVPAGKTVVSESGYQRREQLEELDRIGVDAVLIGETLIALARSRGDGPRAHPRRGADPRAPALRRALSCAQ